MLSFRTSNGPKATPTDGLFSTLHPVDGTAVLARIARSADLYGIVVEARGGRWVASVPALPGRLVEGETPEAARQRMQQAVTGHLLSRNSDGDLTGRLRGEGGMWARQRESMERGLLQALAKDEFRLYYQPAFQLDTGRLAGMEALIRWQHPERGLISPRDFIPEAEAVGLTASIDDWVLGEVCRQLQRWQDIEPTGQRFAMSINVSLDQLHRPNLAHHVFAALQAHGLDQSRLRLEVPEGIAIQHDARARENFQALRSGGVHVAVDDVRAERSALVHLRGLTVDALKIDRPLVKELGDDGRTTALVQAITLLAHAWGMTVTAEGVETAEQAATLRELGCDYGQGFYYGRPVSSAEAGSLLT